MTVHQIQMSEISRALRRRDNLEAYRLLNEELGPILAARALVELLETEGWVFGEDYAEDV